VFKYFRIVFYMRNLLVAIVLLGAPFVVAAADSGNPSKPSKAEVDAFRLSMDKVKAMTAAYSNLLELLANNPKLQEQWKAESRKQKDDDGNGRDELSAVAQRLMQTNPQVAAAFSKAGTSPKEAGMTMETIAGGMIGLAMAEGAGVKKPDLPKGPARDNIEFIQTHKAEIMDILGQMKSLRAKYPQLKLDDDADDQ
jgi:hypothetical protein